MSNVTETLLPWYLGYLGGNWSQAIQCMSAGSNGYRENHASINGGLNNGWARNNTPWSWGYLNRHDLPVQFAIAEGWTVGDMYQVCVPLILNKTALESHSEIGIANHCNKPESSHLSEWKYQCTWQPADAR